jgi:hypothetical protein
LLFYCSSDDDGDGNGAEDKITWLEFNHDDYSTNKYYVSPNGADNRGGEDETLALKTIEKALKKVNPGDTIVILPGIYFTSIGLENFGNEIAAITIMGTQQPPVIDGNGKLPIGIICENCTNVRFRGITGSWYRSDIALDDINITRLTSISENDLNSKINIYPNPGTGLFHMSIDDINAESIDIIVSDPRGRILYSKQIQKNNYDLKTTLDLSGFVPGIYFVNLKSDEFTHTRRIIIQ